MQFKLEPHITFKFATSQLFVYDLPVSYTCNMYVIMVPVKVNMDACIYIYIYMCGINLCSSVITVELTATSTAEWLLA